MQFVSTKQNVQYNCQLHEIYSQEDRKKADFFSRGKIGTHGQQAKWGGCVTTGRSKAWCKDKQQEVASEAVARCIRLLSDLGIRSSQRLLLKKQAPMSGASKFIQQRVTNHKTARELAERILFGNMYPVLWLRFSLTGMRFSLSWLRFSLSWLRFFRGRLGRPRRVWEGNIKTDL